MKTRTFVRWVSVAVAFVSAATIALISAHAETAVLKRTGAHRFGSLIEGGV